MRTCANEGKSGSGKVLEIRDWRFEIGNWRWRFEVGDVRLEM
jgi:hypothetical protein